MDYLKEMRPLESDGKKQSDQVASVSLKAEFICSYPDLNSNLKIRFVYTGITRMTWWRVAEECLIAVAILASRVQRTQSQGDAFCRSPEIMTVKVRCQTLGLCGPSGTSVSSLPPNGSEKAGTE